MKNLNVAKPQTDDGFTKISNSLLKYLCSQPLTSREIRVLLCVLRFTAGFHRSKAELSLSYIANFTGLTKRHTSETLKGLIERKILIVHREAEINHISRIISLSQELGTSVPKSGTVPKSGIDTVPETGTETVPESGTNKERTKESIKKELLNEFDRFWSLYDKKVGKAKSWELWKKLATKDKEEIFARLPSYLEARPEKQFRKDPERYLKNQVWEDEYTGADSKEQTQKKLIIIK